MGDKLGYLERVETESILLGEFISVCLFVFSRVDTFAHLNTLISKIITVKTLFLYFMVHCHIWRRKQICFRLVAKVEAWFIQETEYITN